jgi:hypothetical protein
VPSNKQGVVNVLTWPLLDVICPDVGNIGAREFYGIMAEKKCLQKPLLQIGI